MITTMTDDDLIGLSEIDSIYPDIITFFETKGSEEFLQEELYIVREIIRFEIAKKWDIEI